MPFGGCMKIAFFISSVGDTDLALKTISALEHDVQYQTALISLTKAAQQRIDSFKSPSLVTKTSLLEILQSKSDLYPEEMLSEQLVNMVGKYLQEQKIDYAYIGVPSVNSDIPFQLAESLDIPVLIAYEFMFKPEKHNLWKHVPVLGKKPNVKWAIPLKAAKEDFNVPDESLFVTGHLSIDNAYTPGLGNTKSYEEITKILKIQPDKPFAFVSSTTQPVEIDASFLNCLLSELKHHPKMQVRLGLHPGIQNFDLYLKEILTIYRKHPEIVDQFKIILPDSLTVRIKEPKLTIDDPDYQNAFLRVNITGAEAASAADRISQAVPGALLNQAVLEGKPAYSHLGTPYLPRQYFTNSPALFFTAGRQTPRLKEDLGLDKKTAPEKYVDILMK